MTERAQSPAPATSAASGETEATSFGAWTLIWTLYVVKLATVLFVFLAARSFETAVLLTVTTWLWLGPALILAAAPLAFQIRLRRVRSRRAALLAAEWMTTAQPTPSPGSVAD